MGNSLHNKIYLGRRVSAFNAKGMTALVFLGAIAACGLFWCLFHTLK